MSVQANILLEEHTLNMIWRADRKRGMSFWDSTSEQFRLIHETFKRIRTEEREACIAIARKIGQRAMAQTQECPGDEEARGAYMSARLIESEIYLRGAKEEK